MRTSAILVLAADEQTDDQTEMGDLLRSVVDHPGDDQRAEAAFLLRAGWSLPALERIPPIEPVPATNPEQRPEPRVTSAILRASLEARDPLVARTCARLLLLKYDGGDREAGLRHLLGEHHYDDIEPDCLRATPDLRPVVHHLVTADDLMTNVALRRLIWRMQSEENADVSADLIVLQDANRTLRTEAWEIIQSRQEHLSPPLDLDDTAPGQPLTDYKTRTTQAHVKAERRDLELGMTALGLDLLPHRTE
jgi:hypothetical protein